MGRFIALLLVHGIETVVDVRRAPVSKHVPRFNKDRLEPLLTTRGFEYLYRGRELGGVPASQKADADRFFAEISRKPEFMAALNEIAESAPAKKMVILCAERDFKRCHRHLLLEPELSARGLTVLHIDGEGRLRAADEDDQLKLF